MNIRDILKGTHIGSIQVDSNMTVISLIIDDKKLLDDNLVSPKNAIVGTKGYGSVSVKNPDNKILFNLN